MMGIERNDAEQEAGKVPAEVPAEAAAAVLERRDGRWVWMHKVSEEDLQALEQILPLWSQQLGNQAPGRASYAWISQTQDVREILSRIRWGYGPADPPETPKRDVSGVRVREDDGEIE